MREHLKPISAKEIKLFLDRCLRTCQRKLKLLRKYYGKEKRAPVSRLEFALYYKYDIEMVVKIIKESHRKK